MLIQVLTSAAAADKEQLLQTKKFFSSIYIRVLRISFAVENCYVYQGAAGLLEYTEGPRVTQILCYEKFV